MTAYLEPTQETGRNFIMRAVSGEDVESSLAFSANADYMAGIGHRTAALEDSRLLPLTPMEDG